MGVSDDAPMDSFVMRRMRMQSGFIKDCRMGQLVGPTTVHDPLLGITYEVNSNDEVNNYHSLDWTDSVVRMTVERTGKVITGTFGPGFSILPEKLYTLSIPIQTQEQPSYAYHSTYNALTLQDVKGMHLQPLLCQLPRCQGQRISNLPDFIQQSMVYPI